MPKTSKENRTQPRDTREKGTTSLFFWRRLIHKEMRKVKPVKIIF
jgi:hypothetical protein